MMKSFTLPILTLVAGAYGDLSPMDMHINESPMTAVSVFSEKYTCRPYEWTPHTDTFRTQAQRVIGDGFCYTQMTRMLSGNVTDYLSKTGQSLDAPKVDFVKFVVDIDAETHVQNYIKMIFFKQQKPGTNCSSSRLSMAGFGEEPRYFKDLSAGSDKNPFWTMPGRHQLLRAKYLLEVPRSCLSAPTEVVFHTEWVYEGAAMGVQLLKGRGSVVGQSRACSVSTAQIDTQDKYSNLVRSLPRKCGSAFDRDYAWGVSPNLILVEAGKTTVMASISLNEPLIADHERRVTSVALGPLDGECAGINVYARRKGKHDDVDSLVERVVLRDGRVYAEAPWKFSDPIYDFRFVLPIGCTVQRTILPARVTAHVVDSKVDEYTPTERPSFTETTITLGYPIDHQFLRF